MEQKNYNIIGNICYVVITTIIIPTKFYALNNIVSKFMKKKILIIVGDRLS